MNFKHFSRMRGIVYFILIFISVFSLSSCTNGKEKNTKIDANSNSEIPTLEDFKADSWLAYGIIYEDNKDSVYLGEPYNLHFNSGIPAKVLPEKRHYKVAQTGVASYHIPFDSSTDLFIEEFYESEEEVRLVYQLKSEISESNMPSSRTLRITKMGMEGEDKSERVKEFITEYYLDKSIHYILKNHLDEDE